MKEKIGTAPENTIEFGISPQFGLNPIGNLHLSSKKNLSAKKSLLRSYEFIQSVFVKPIFLKSKKRIVKTKPIDPLNNNKKVFFLFVIFIEIKLIQQYFHFNYYVQKRNIQETRQKIQFSSL